LLAKLGGIARSIHFIAAGMVILVSRALFMNSILGQLFLVKKTGSGFKLKDQKRMGMIGSIKN